jgi:hypothetical protein
VDSALAGQVPAEVLELTREGVGVATLATVQLPAELAAP